MRSPLRLLSALLALLFWVQGSFALAHCLRLSPVPHTGGGFTVLVCSSDGLVLREIPSDTEDLPQGSAPAMGLCVACHILPQIVLPAPIDVPAPRVAALPAPPRAWSDDAPPQGARAAPYPATGPPRLI